MADIFPLQQDVNRKAALHVYFGPQVAKSRNGVSIIWRAGRPSGWTLPRILVLFKIMMHAFYRLRKWMPLPDWCIFRSRTGLLSLLILLFLFLFFACWSSAFQKSLRLCSVVSNRIGMKFRRIVLRVNTHRLTSRISDVTSYSFKIAGFATADPPLAAASAVYKVIISVYSSCSIVYSHVFYWGWLLDIWFKPIYFQLI